jgi:hypothetical protein
MEKLVVYRAAIRAVLSRHIHPYSVGDIEVSLVADEECDHYQVFIVGWSRQHYHFGPTISMQIKRGKVWIHHNGTEFNLAQELMELGVAKSDIVLGWQPPEIRKFTDYAVG